MKNIVDVSENTTLKTIVNNIFSAWTQANHFT